METTVTEQTAPIPWRNLRLVRGGTKGGTPAPGTDPVPGGTEGGTGGVAVPLPVPGGTGTEVVPLTPAERAHLAARHWAELAANGAGQLWLHPDRLGHSLYHGKPGSLAEHRAYIKSREWVPPDLDGKSAKFIGGSGVVYHLLIARPLKAACLTVSAAADKPLRLAGLIALVLIFALAVVPHIPLT
jgi:hypothetical protein